jgi:hypothetical protein
MLMEKVRDEKNKGDFGVTAVNDERISNKKEQD